MKTDYEGTKVETTQGWHMVKSLSATLLLRRRKIAVHATKHPNVFRGARGIRVEGEGSTTIPHKGVRNILIKEL